MDMNKQIEDIKKNMTSKFEGYVNGMKFNDRNEMNAYIGKCISEGTPIENMSFSETTQYNEQPCGCNVRPTNGRKILEQKQREISWLRYINEVNQKVPKPYDTVIGYVVPFIREDIFIADSNRSEVVVNDFVNKLTERMKFMEAFIFSEIRTWKYDESQVYEWLNTLISGLQHKIEWCNQRIAVIEELCNVVTDKLLIANINVAGLECFHKIYNEAGGFCSALLDICLEMQKSLQCGQGK